MAATSDLHREVGPARTTVAEVARRAGVQRLTVYNHFPELGELFGACQAHFLAAHPPPELWPAGPASLESGLRSLYAWFRANQEMQRHVHHDRHLVPELDALLRATSDSRFDQAASEAVRMLAARPGEKKALHTLLRVALSFETWEVMAAAGMDDGEMARLFRRAADCLRRPDRQEGG